MCERILIEFIQSGLWPLLVGVVVWFFKDEIKRSVQSLSSFTLAGATFEFRDKAQTIRSHMLLAETFLDVLSKPFSGETLAKLMDPAQAEKLGNFAVKYNQELPIVAQVEEPLAGIALILIRTGRYTQAVDMLDSLLLKRPGHPYLLNLKALALINARLPDTVKEGEKILEQLLIRYPEDSVARFNHALALSLLERDEDAVNEMHRALGAGYWRTDPNCLDDPLFHHVRNHRLDLFLTLIDHRNSLMKPHPPSSTMPN